MAKHPKKKTKRPSFSQAAGSKGVPRDPQGRPVRTRTVKTRTVDTQVVRNTPVKGGGPQPKRGPDVKRPSRDQGAVAKAAARIRNSKVGTSVFKSVDDIFTQIKEDPVGFALRNPRKPIRQAQLPTVSAPGVNRQLAATKFGRRQRKPRKSAKVARRKRT